MYTTYYTFSITLLSLATTDRQDLTHNEESPRHMKVRHNETDAVSPEPAEEHQDTADNFILQERERALLPS